MNINRPLDLLGGLSPQAFMRHYWQRKPLLVRQAIPGFRPNLSIADIKQLVRRDEVESRLIRRDGNGWNMKSGPFARLPAARAPNWTLLAQSVDLHDDATADLLHRFRFISDARLDDAMISIATDGGGVGPHFDSYDVFLLQALGQRRWRISSQKDLTLEPGLPLKILKNFKAEHEYLLEPGDMLYLPPQVAHDGVAVGDCMTISIGFRAPTLSFLAQGLLEQASEQIAAIAHNTADAHGLRSPVGFAPAKTYSDIGSPATATPARLPDLMVNATLDAIKKIRFDDTMAAQFLGLWLTELPPNAYFEPDSGHIDLNSNIPATGALVLDRCTRLMYRDKQLFINGEVSPAPALKIMRELADARQLKCTAATAKMLRKREAGILTSWLREGWLHYAREEQ
jgi:50S ribosomal protein L16 3-hydroxylase